MAKTIVVPIDMSHLEKADVMIQSAKQLAGDDGTIVLVNIVEEIPAHLSAELPGGVVAKAKSDAHAKLEELASTIGIKTETEVRNGHAQTGILTIAEDKNADVIVIASHKPGLADYFLGSTASRVVRHANCSVFVLR